MSLNMAVVATIQLTPKVIGIIRQFIIQVRDPRSDRSPGRTEPPVLVPGSLIRVGSRQKLRKRLSLAELGINPKRLGSIKINIIAHIKMNQSSCKKTASTIQDLGSLLRLLVVEFYNVDDTNTTNLSPTSVTNIKLAVCSEL